MHFNPHSYQQVSFTTFKVQLPLINWHWYTKQYTIYFLHISIPNKFLLPHIECKLFIILILSADFGLARKYGLPQKPMTPTVVTLW